MMATFLVRRPWLATLSHHCFLKAQEAAASDEVQQPGCWLMA
jgi:hypothetical protein